MVLNCQDIRAYVKAGVCAIIHWTYWLSYRHRCNAVSLPSPPLPYVGAGYQQAVRRVPSYLFKQKSLSFGPSNEKSLVVYNSFWKRYSIKKNIIRLFPCKHEILWTAY
jgi:hypothetical protein